MRLQAFGVTEPAAGTDTTSISTFAERKGENILSMDKKYGLVVEHSDLLLLLARTTPKDQIEHNGWAKRILIDLREAIGHGLLLSPLKPW